MPVYIWVNKVQTIHTIWAKLKGLSALNKEDHQVSILQEPVSAALEMGKIAVMNEKSTCDKQD